MASGEVRVRKIVFIVALQSRPLLSALSKAQDSVCHIIHKHEAVFLDGFLLCGFDFSCLFRFGNAFLLEVVLMRGAKRAHRVVERDDEVVCREAEHLTLVVGLPA